MFFEAQNQAPQKILKLRHNFSRFAKRYSPWSFILILPQREVLNISYPAGRCKVQTVSIGGKAEESQALRWISPAIEVWGFHSWATFENAGISVCQSEAIESLSRCVSWRRGKLWIEAIFQEIIDRNQSRSFSAVSVLSRFPSLLPSHRRRTNFEIVQKIWQKI